jgi:hypothetical protein
MADVVRVKHRRTGSVVAVSQEKADQLVAHHGYEAVESKAPAKKAAAKKSSSKK